MLIEKHRLKSVLVAVLDQRLAQGADLHRGGVITRIEAASDSYDALYELALELREPPIRSDWAYLEPVDWPGIQSASPKLDPQAYWPEPDFERAGAQASAGFLGSVCGGMLGKPIEIDPTLAELKKAAQGEDGWPLDNYVSVDFLRRLGRRHESWRETTRGHISAVSADDDIHYTLLGMKTLQQYGRNFSHSDLYELWSLNIPHGWTWGPERSTLLVEGINRHHLFEHIDFVSDSHDVLLLNPGDELCGALIRADAYGYACPGNPDLAAWLAWKDASFTHIKTGVYGSMFVAALIAACHGAVAGRPGNHRLALVEEARARVPSNTRFSEVIASAQSAVEAADDWESGYAAIHGRYRRYSHCAVYQEIGTLLNTLKFARDIGHGIGLQVSQGNDTDSFGATAGSILGVLFGPGYLEERWLRPFGDQLHHGLSADQEYRVSAHASNIAGLPRILHSSASK